RCFPHIMNLACHDVEQAIDQMRYGPGNQGPLANIDRNPIASLRTLIKSIRSSSLRREVFAEKVVQAELGSLQLLRDVDVQWSSTDIMIERAILLCEPILSFLQGREQRELQKYQLSDDEWTVLRLFHEILHVPHAFQQKLSAEKTPTLCDVLPAFSAFLARWRLLQEQMPEMEEVIQASLDKLEDYFLKVMYIPAYNFAMSKSHLAIVASLTPLVVLNPKMKLRWYEHHDPLKLEWVKNLFMQEVFFCALLSMSS
ncbi:hypothetical protein ARMSODRAFT_899917, partial [Armillaria solidipes]